MEAIKPGPKSKKDNGNDDKRRGIEPVTKPKHPDLIPHIHKPKINWRKMGLIAIQEVTSHRFKVLNKSITYYLSVLQQV